MKRLCIRFDIDTPTCLHEGVPRLLDLNERMGFRSTYFLSVGRAVSRAETLGRMLTRSRSRVPRAIGFSSMHKLGLLKYVRLAILNPHIGRSAPRIVTRMVSAADVGLHGGRNHDDWQHHAHEWSRPRVESEVDWALAWLRGLGVSVAGFSSPGWNDPRDLSSVLKERGFVYRADLRGAGLVGAVAEPSGLLNVATNLCGEPAGVAYLENMRARGLSDAQIRDEFRRDLMNVGDGAVMYDHPYYAGLHALQLLEDLIAVAQDDGYTLVTMLELAQSFADQSPDSATS